MSGAEHLLSFAERAAAAEMAAACLGALPRRVCHKSTTCHAWGCSVSAWVPVDEARTWRCEEHQL